MIWGFTYQIEDVRSSERNNAVSSTLQGHLTDLLTFIIICSGPVVLIPLCTYPVQPAPNDNKPGKTVLYDTGLQINQ